VRRSEVILGCLVLSVESNREKMRLDWEEETTVGLPWGIRSVVVW
jgi:hypothetical protein